ncbi:MAG: helix-turn-helix domain-containing protein [Saprospiraceae bacterium]|nr:helix-turn-helix domain-containing protein [Pyrinomonadaceae bacterium]
METLINEMLDGQILLDEAITEFEKLYIQRALERHSDHISKTANALGIHRNTLSKRVSSYQQTSKSKSKRLSAKRGK